LACFQNRFKIGSAFNIFLKICYPPGATGRRQALRRSTKSGDKLMQSTKLAKLAKLAKLERARIASNPQQASSRQTPKVSGQQDFWTCRRSRVTEWYNMHLAPNKT
jgi:hypothetical protein